MKIYDFFSKGSNGIISILTISFLLRIPFLATSWGSYDEGTYMMTSKLVLLGHPLFSQTFSSQPPLLFYSIAFMDKLFGISVLSARMTMILYTLAFLFIIYLIALQLTSDKLLALLLSFLLSISPFFFVLSRSVEAEVPAITFCALAFFLLFSFFKTRSFYFLAGSAISFALACLAKLTIFYFFPLFLFLFLVPKIITVSSYTKKEKLSFITVYIGLTFATSLLFLLPYFPSFHQVFYQLVQFHQIASSGAINFSAYFQVLKDFIIQDGIFFIISAYYIGIFSPQRYTYLFTFSLCSFLFLSLLLLHQQPPFLHDFAILFLPLILMSIPCIEEIKTHHTNIFSHLFIPFILIYIFGTLISDVHFLYAERKDTMDTRNTIVSFIEQHSEQNAYILTDFPEIAFRSGRNSIPQLVDPSQVTLTTNAISSKDLYHDTKQYNPALIVLWRGTLASDDPQYVAYLQKSCTILYTQDATRIYGHCEFKM